MTLTRNITRRVLFVLVITGCRREKIVLQSHGICAMNLGMVIVFGEEDSNLGGKLRRRRLSRRLGSSEQSYHGAWTPSTLTYWKLDWSFLRKCFF